MTKYTVMPSVARCASVWLWSALKKNASEPVTITHEMFRTGAHLGIEKWHRSSEKAVAAVDVGSSCHLMLPAIEGFGAQVCMLLREPASWIEALLARMLHFHKNLSLKKWKKDPKENAVRFACFTFFSTLETIIAVAEPTLADISYWGMGHFTKEAGFRELAEKVGVPLQDTLDLNVKRNATKPEHKVDFRKWFPKGPDIVYSMLKHFPRLCEGYLTAKRSGHAPQLPELY